MKVTVLGNNGAYPAAGGACSSYLIESNGIKILADAGSGSLSNLMRIMDPADLDAIIITHLHWDHITDLPVLYYNLHLARIKGHEIENIQLYMPDSPAGQFEIIEGFNAYDVNILNENSELKIGGITITTAPMTHPVQTYALKFSDGEKSLVFSADTTFNAGLVKLAAGCNMLLADSAFLDEDLTPASPHMSAAQCARIASDAGVEKLMLTHLMADTNPQAYLDEALGIFKYTSITKILETYEV